MSGHPDVYICRADAGEGTKDYVSLLPPDVVGATARASNIFLGTLSRELRAGERVDTSMFVPSSAFPELLHAFLVDEAPRDRRLVIQAKKSGTGWIYIIDQRTPTPGDAVPPEDIIGAFEVRNGQLVPGSYKPNPRHLLLSTTGFFRLGRDMHANLVRYLQNAARGQ